MHNYFFNFILKDSEQIINRQIRKHVCYKLIKLKFDHHENKSVSTKKDLLKLKYSFKSDL